MALAGEQDGWAFDNHSSNWLLNSLPGKENNILNVSTSKLMHMSRQLLNGSLVFIINKRINNNTFYIIHMINKHRTCHVYALHNFYDISLSSINSYCIIRKLRRFIINQIYLSYIINTTLTNFLNYFKMLLLITQVPPPPPQLNKTQQKQTTANQKQRKKATPFSSLKASPC